MITFLLIYLLVNNAFANPPTQNQLYDASWLSNQIYQGVDAMNTNSGCVIRSRQTDWEGAYAIWKHYRTKECYVVIRGTEIKSLIDILTDLNVLEVYDDEIEATVHNGVKLRGDAILKDIDDKLKECKRDIIITGHSLGGAVSHYIFLKYVKRHYYDWGLGEKAERFKAVMFGAPQLISRSNNELLVNHEDNIHWYKYESDIVPEIIKTVKSIISIRLSYFLFRDAFCLTDLILEAFKLLSIGHYIPGHKYHLWVTGEKEEYRYIFCKNLNLFDHMMNNYLEAIHKKGWGEENRSYDDSDTTSCLRMNYFNFLSEEGNSISKENSLSGNDDGTIDIDTSDCEDVKDYKVEARYQNIFLYLKDDNKTYIIKRLLDNGKEYEYALCSNNGFVLKQCDGKCNCHEVVKNDRPKKITMCSSYQMESAMSCLIDGEVKNVELRDYFSLFGETKIENYYLMDYYCNNQHHQRGNYQNNSQKITVSFILLMMLLISL